MGVSQLRRRVEEEAGGDWLGIGELGIGTDPADWKSAASTFASHAADSESDTAGGTIYTVG
jgi:hypothetical protein